MGLGEVAQLLERRPPPTPATLRTAVVVRADATGVWAVPVGADRRTPLGPCRGGTRTPAATLPAGGEAPHTHPIARVALAVGTVVLLHTDGAQRPWIIAWEDPDA